MYCKNCNKEISDKAAICIGCGAEVKQPVVKDGGGAGWWWLGFLVPVAGLLIWVTCNDNQPNRAKKAGIGALVGAITSAVLVILVYVLWFLLMIMLANGTLV